MLESRYFYTNSQELTVKIKATYVCPTLCSLQSLCSGERDACQNQYICAFRYLFGEDVTGTAYGVFGVIYRGKKHSFPSSLQRVEVIQPLQEYSSFVPTFLFDLSALSSDRSKKPINANVSELILLRRVTELSLRCRAQSRTIQVLLSQLRFFWHLTQANEVIRTWEETPWVYPEDTLERLHFPSSPGFLAALLAEELEQIVGSCRLNDLGLLTAADEHLSMDNVLVFDSVLE